MGYATRLQEGTTGIGGAPTDRDLEPGDTGIGGEPTNR